MRARFVTINKGRGYAHAENADGRYFVHAHDCDFVLDDCRVRDLVEIGDVELTPKGPRARNVRWVDRGSAPDAVDDLVEGVVINVQTARGFAFLRPDGADDEEDDVFCHVRNFVDFDGDSSPTFRALSRTDRLRCGRRRSTRGWRGERIERVSP
jgi:cold shock CspA family protein